MNYFIKIFFLTIILINSSLADDISLNEPNKIGDTTIETKKFGGSTTVITEDEIKTSGAQSIGDLLKLVPGLSVKQSGSRGGLISVFARGQESDHNLVIIDGIKMNDVGGSFNYEYIPINNIQSIEVLRGPMAGFFGSEALGSVIIINTKNPTNETQISLMASMGFNQSFSKDTVGQTDGGAFFVNEESISISGPLNKDSNDVRLDYSVAFQRVDDDGFRIFNDSFNNKSLNAKLNITALENKLKIRSSLFDSWATVRYPTNNSGAVGSYSSTSGTQRDFRHLNSRGVSTTYEIYDYSQIGFDYSYFFNKRATRDSGSSNVDWWEKKKKYNYYYKLNNYVNSGITFNSKLGFEYTDERSNYHANASSYATDYGHNTYVESFYGMFSINFYESLVADVALRKDDHEYHGSTYSPTMFVSKFINPQIKIRGGYSQGIKYPGIYETYSAINLKPEENESYEIGVDYQNNIYSLSLTLFKSKSDNMIAYRSSGSPSYRNLDEAKYQGLELSGLLKLQNELSLKYFFTYLETKAVNANNTVQQNSYNYANWQNDEALLRRPKTSGGLILSKTYENYFVSIDTTYTGGRWDYENSTTRLYNHSYWDFGLYGDYTFNNTKGYKSKIFLTISNMFNDKREEILNFTSPGRTVMVGFRYDTSN